VGFVLLLACSNVASLLLARGAARQREIAIRAALGAGRGRIIRQLLTESLVLSLGAGLCGVLLALWGVGFLVQMFPKKLGNVAIPRIDHLPVDGKVLAFTVVVSLVTGIVFGLAPALAASRTDVERALREGQRGGSARSSRLRRWLVASEIAIGVVLTAGAGLVAQSFARLANAEAGFDASNVHTGRVVLSRQRYATPERQRAFVRDVVTRLRAQPGVTEAGCVSTLPLSGWWNSASFTIDGAPQDELKSTYAVVEPGYFATLRIPLVRGRWFEASDRADGPKVALVDEILARRYFPGRDPVGRRINLGSAAEPEWHQIVGVVGHIRENGLAEPERPAIYASFQQIGWPVLGFVARGGDLASVRAAVWAVDPDQPVSYSMTMRDLVADALTLRRVTMLVLLAFAGLALGLAAMGVYGVMAFAVTQRTHEIGVRVALGARRADVLRLVLAQALQLLLVGIGIGLPAALLLARTLRSQLYGVAPADPIAFGGTIAVLSAIALLAAWLPARRAARIDPMIALRAD
jgi:putative ABC transport system permease protein